MSDTEERLVAEVEALRASVEALRLQVVSVDRRLPLDLRLATRWSAHLLEELQVLCWLVRVPLIRPAIQSAGCWQRRLATSCGGVCRESSEAPLAETGLHCKVGFTS